MRKLKTISITRRSQGFTLIELLTVVTIIAALVAITLPAIKSLAKSNDRSQAVNVVRSYVSSARGIALAQHRMAGVVFFEEDPLYSGPTANKNQTAMQIFVEDYNQAQYNPAAGATVFVYYSTQRQYLPSGIKLAALSDIGTGIQAVENSSYSAKARAILFDANGQLLLRGGLAFRNGPLNAPGFYPNAAYDWKFVTPGLQNPGGGAANAFSSPGFFLYSKSDYDAKNFTSNPADDVPRHDWLVNNSDVVIVNNYTGNVIR